MNNPISPFQPVSTGIPVTKNHYINVTGIRHDTLTTNNLFVRILLPNGQISVMKFEFHIQALDTPETHLFRLTDGILISVSCESQYTTLAFPALHIRASLQRGETTSIQPLFVFFSRFLTGYSPLSWPMGNFRQIDEEHTYTYSAHPGNSSPGSGFSWLNSTPYFYYLHFISFLFNTDSNTATRNVSLTLFNISSINSKHYFYSSQSASSSNKYFSSQFFPYTNSGIGIINRMPLPYKTPIEPGGSFSVSADNIQPGDYFSYIFYSLEVQPSF